MFTWPSAFTPLVLLAALLLQGCDILHVPRSTEDSNYREVPRDQLAYGKRWVVRMSVKQVNYVALESDSFSYSYAERFLDAGDEVIPFSGTVSIRTREGFRKIKTRSVDARLALFADTKVYGIDDKLVVALLVRRMKDFRRRTDCRLPVGMSEPKPAEEMALWGEFNRQTGLFELDRVAYTNPGEEYRAWSRDRKERGITDQPRDDMGVWIDQYDEIRIGGYRRAQPLQCD